MLTTRQYQRLLGVEPDGDFGPASRSALRAFQETHGLDADGRTGPQSAAALLAAEAGYQIASLPPGPRRQVLDRALADVGKRESPRGSNAGAAIEHLEPDGQPWCGSAVCSWVRLGTGGEPWPLTPFGRKLAMVLHRDDHPTWPSLERWARERGVLVEEPSPGAILLMRRDGSGSDGGGGGHTGLVVGPVGPDVLSIDGNVGDGVGLRLRSPSEVIGFAEWWRV